MITNSGSQRFDIYSGAFTKNDELTASPFSDAFLFIPNVTASIAAKVLPALNNQGAQERRSLEVLEARERELYGLGYVDKRYTAWLREMNARDGHARRAAANQTIGYVTHDVRDSFLLFVHNLTFISISFVRSRAQA